MFITFIICAEGMDIPKLIQQVICRRKVISHGKSVFWASYLVLHFRQSNSLKKYDKCTDVRDVCKS